MGICLSKHVECEICSNLLEEYEDKLSTLPMIKIDHRRKYKNFKKDRRTINQIYRSELQKVL